MTQAIVNNRRTPKIFAIPATNSKHRSWSNKNDEGKFSTINYSWHEVIVSGKSSKDMIAISVAKTYNTYNKAQIKNISDGIYYYSRILSGDYIIQFNNSKIQKIGQVTKNVELEYANVTIEVEWVQNLQTTNTRTSIFNESVEIQKINKKQSIQLGLPNYFGERLSDEFIAKEYTNLKINESINLDPKLNPGGEISLFYCTNRNKTGSNHVNQYYGDDIDDPVLGSCIVSIPPGHKQGEIERPMKMFSWLINENQNKHVILSSIHELSHDTFYNWLSEGINKAENKSALLFIHGYNTTFAEAAWRTGQIAHDIPFNGISGFFSWPSGGKTLDYTKDIEKADASVRDLKKFIVDFLDKTKARQLNIIAHSMGNRIITTVLNQLISEGTLNEKLKIIHQIVLAAPDIDKEVFDRNILPQFKNIGERRTLYASDKDRALKWSQRLRFGLPRIGEAGDDIYVAEGLDTIDASNVSSEGNNHSYIFECNELLYDLFLLLDKGFSPSERRLRKVQKEMLSYWLFNE